MLIILPGWSQRSCRSFDYRQQQLSLHPALASAVAANEQFTRRQLAAVEVEGAAPTRGGNISSSLITIPVIVHVVYNTPEQNVSDAQIRSQIDVLNRDYQKQNPDTADIPGYYRSFAADCGFRFVLAGLDTNGRAISGILRKHTNITAFSIEDDMKFSASGGDDAWDRDRYLNIWVCNLQGSVLGYSSLVGGPKETDGVVIAFGAFGTSGSARAPYNLGRTATHEIGHWLNMIHVWGDADCGDDQVADTPPQSQATYGDPAGVVVSCGNTPYGNMYMDYMDFTDDIGMHMFTHGQRDRMRTLFAPGGFRYALLTSTAASVAALVTDTPAQLVTGDNHSPTLSLYPNPAVSQVSVKMSEASCLGSMLEVYDQMGQRVMASRITDLSFGLDVSHLSSGVYFIRINDGRGASGYKFVKL
ncbi:M43 family zinc metalloprotease [Puia sp.]|uniref:M43 family zinc metalloprotease n=1 Tax=Puia sp. TaxID=2045100 RepID=UPI002F42CF33